MLYLISKIRASLDIFTGKNVSNKGPNIAEVFGKYFPANFIAERFFAKLENFKFETIIN
jgi:hypothetical protein